MTTIYRALPLFIVLWMALAAPSPRAQEPPAAAAPVVVREQPMFDGGVLDFVKVFGLGGMIFVIWLFDYRRQRSLESIIEEYKKIVQDNAKLFDATQQAHLAAFRDINERNLSTFKEAMLALQKVAEEAKDNAVMCATVNTRVAERLDYLSKERAA